MSTAPLKSTEVASGDSLAKQLADIIDIEVKDANSVKTTSAEDTASKIDQLFQDSVAANSDGAEDFLYTLWDVVLESAVTIPATDQRLQQLIDVIKALQKKNTAEVEIWGAKTSVWKDLPMLGPALREAWNFKPELDGTEDHASLQKWISLNSFAARILGHKIQSSFNLGLWELRAGLEEKHPSDASRDLHLNTTSEWLWHAGNELYRLSYNGTLSQGDVDMTKTGSLVAVPTKGLSKDRWTFWKKRLGELSSEMSCAAKEEGLKERVDGVIQKMSTIEKGGR
ncbi:hypothetical protein ISF_02209 [Cordyceps fumosorosea ARSEF 2679]|uniref:Uncharacterized protein n=1 Tax=Cordyceps fumosorosea (strain ARSEF 2679) TaxID=1081104 RepID=A0A168BKN2_CORFA|nr:hypothetical protein ISF_02209 [Cordyceps fumosorosea ARSEF 2679]OAA70235.1 hypothetical protein ISF_02209 [Cordyceps fumosorosea ARSEF 2679]